MSQPELFLFIDKNSKNPDKVDSLIPFKVNEQYHFFGPGHDNFRRDMRKRFLTHREDVPVENEIYLIGFSEVSKKFPQRKIIWISKMLRVMNFASAGSLLNEPGFESLEFVPDPKNPELNISPLHIQPMDLVGSFTGYRARSEFHSKKGKDGLPEWAKDVMDPRDSELFTFTGVDLYLNNQSNRKNAYRRDSCFLCEHVFYAEGEGLDVSDRVLECLCEWQPGKEIDNTALFGYKTSSSGRKSLNTPKGGYLQIRFRIAENLMDHISSMLG